MFISVLCFVLAIYLMVRSKWVYNNRIKAIDIGKSNKLLSYKVMMRKFWIWDFDKLKIKENKNGN